MQKHVAIALPSIVDIGVMEEGFEVVEGRIPVSSEDGSRCFSCGRAVPADPRLGAGRNCMEFCRVLEVAENVGVLEVSFGEVEARRYLDKDLSNVRNESILGKGVIDDNHLIGFLCILKLFSIAGVSQGYSRSLESSHVGNVRNRSSSSGKWAHMEPKSSIGVFYHRDIISGLIYVAQVAKQVILGDRYIVENDISVIDIIQPVLWPTVSDSNSWQNPMCFLASQRNDEGVRAV